MHEHYDVVVIGTGYGGGIAASRIARAGRSVCVLEKGKELHPGEYPEDITSAARHIQIQTKKRRIGSPTALIDIQVGSDIGVVRGCGLGGTSLINANVALRADPAIFADDRWPSELKHNAVALDPYYDRAEQMLGSQVPPTALPTLPKVDALAESGVALGTAAEAARVNVTFASGPNAAGIHQDACTLCGNCITGCNHNAKNTVLMNYIPDAYRHGAHIFTEIQVRAVHERPAGGWLIEFCTLGAGRRRFGSRTQFVTADVVVLAAGSLGSTEILLRSRCAGLPLSDRLGLSFNGNGDVLAFAFDTDRSVRAIGTDAAPVADPIGTCITAMIDLRNAAEPEKNMLIQEGAVPNALGPIFGVALGASALAFGKDASGGWAKVRKRLGQLGRSLLGPRRGTADRTLTFLVMSVDDDTGELALEDDELKIRWPNVSHLPIFEHINTTLRRASDALNGTFVSNPTWASPFGSRLLTVQPLGGCDMGDHAKHGVVNHKGQVFAGTTGSAVHRGLYVADGAIVPRPLGKNPSLTISALAERIAELLLVDRGWTPPVPGPSPALPVPSMPAEPIGVRFSERMQGHFSTRVTSDFDQGAVQGRAEGSPIEVVLTIEYDELAAVLKDPSASAHLTGTVTAPALAARRLNATGTFRLFVDAGPTGPVETCRMIYDLDLRGENNERYHLQLFKVMRERGSMYAWVDTTTAYARISDTSGKTGGVGIVRIGVIDFLKLLSTVDAVHAPDASVRSRSRVRFLWMFLKRLLRIYGGVLDATGQFDPPPPTELPITKRRPLKLGPATTHTTHLYEGGSWRTNRHWGPDTELFLWRFQGGTKGPVMVSGGFAMSSSAFLLDTVETNLVEYLYGEGYDVWLFDDRGSIVLDQSRKPYTLDQVAKEDWPRAVEYVRTLTGKDVQVIAHCTGALTFQMAMISGMTGVRSAVLSALTLYLDANVWTKAKTLLRLENVIPKLVAGVSPPRKATPVTKAIDALLRLHPIESQERCGQAVCRFMNAIYGKVHLHARLNDATHDILWWMYDYGSFTAVKQYAKSFRRGKMLDANGDDTYTNLSGLAIPILFLHGDRNTMFHPKGSERTMSELGKANGAGLYERQILRDYAHLDAFLGQDAHTDVFPMIEGHLKRFP
jgi:cholesterol oxidase